MNYLSLDYGKFIDTLGTYVVRISSYSIMIAIFVVYHNRHFPYYNFKTAIYHTYTQPCIKLIVIRQYELKILDH